MTLKRILVPFLLLAAGGAASAQQTLSGFAPVYPVPWKQDLSTSPAPLFAYYSGPEDWVLDIAPESRKELADRGIQLITTAFDKTYPLPMNVSGSPWGSGVQLSLAHYGTDESALDGKIISVNLTATIGSTTTTGAFPVLLVPNVTLNPDFVTSSIAGQPMKVQIGLEPADVLSLFDNGPGCDPSDNDTSGGCRIWKLGISYGWDWSGNPLPNPDPLFSARFDPPESHPSSLTMFADACDNFGGIAVQVIAYPRPLSALQIPIAIWGGGMRAGSDGMVNYIGHQLDCSTATVRPGVLAANGSLVTVTVGGVKSMCKTASVSVDTFSVFADEPMSGTTPDAFTTFPFGGPTTQLRATRNSTGDGRVYHLYSFISDGFTGCTATNTVCVPLTKGGTCTDEGALYDSTGNGNTSPPW
jgi:hypothetical protein